MGTTLANIHILNSDLERVSSLMPDAIAGIWSERCVSVFSSDFLPGLVDNKARWLSKKLPQPVLSVWLADSDAIGLSIFQNGKRVAEHRFDPDGWGNRLGNIPLFCLIWGLPDEDVPRLRAVWRKAHAEDRLRLTSALLGLPLYHDSEIPPNGKYGRDAEAVDRWISERPKPPRIKNTASVELIQEITEARYTPPDRCGGHCLPFAVSAEPEYDPETLHTWDKNCHVWMARPDGTLGEIWHTDMNRIRLSFRASDDRIICMDSKEKTVYYDSAGLLRPGAAAPGHFIFISGGRLLKTGRTFFCLSPSGETLWRRDYHLGRGMDFGVFAHNDKEFILRRDDKTSFELIRVDIASGEEIDTLDCTVGLNTDQRVWHNGSWWVTHDGLFRRDWVRTGKVNYQLTRLNESWNITGSAPLPDFSQDIFFSPDNKYVYVFIFERRVLVLDADELSVVNILEDRDFLAPLGFDGGPRPRFWLQRHGSTVEAWDAMLTKPLSRHRLKGGISFTQYADADGRLCILTYEEKKSVLRVYRLF